MAKIALLIGVSEYEPGLNPLPGATRDVEAMQRVLQHSQIGEFDEVKTLANPNPLDMQQAIEDLFSGRTKDDLVLLFFSGHGVKDDNGRLYLSTRITRKTQKGELIKATAVPTSFVQDIMSNSRSRRQVVILDCCFSGAFAEGWSAKDDGSVDVKAQLGGEGRAVLTSSTSTQYSFEQEGADLSTYTRYLVEGIETGAADLNSDGIISIDELHEYAKRKVQEAAPAMKPEIYAIKEGFKINLAQATTQDPKVRYRKEVEHFANRGKISLIGRTTLDSLRESLGLSSDDAKAIEEDVLNPYQIYQAKLQRYEQVLIEAAKSEQSLTEDTRNELRRLQQVLKLRDEDVEQIEAKINGQNQATPTVIESVEPVPIAQSLPTEATTPVAPKKEPVTVSRTETPASSSTEILKNSAVSASGLKNTKVLIGVGVAVSILFLGLLIEKQVSEQKTEPVSTASPTASSDTSTETTGSSSSTNDSEVVQNSEVFFQKGLNKLTQQDYQGAIADYDQAIKINKNWGADNPDSGYFGLATTYFNRALSWENLREYEKAMADYDQAIKLKPDDSQAYKNRGDVKYNKEDYKGAIADYDQAIQINKYWATQELASNSFGLSLAYAYVSRGNAKDALKKYSEAIADYDQAIKISPENADAYYARGDTKETTGDKSGAIADFQKAAKLYEQQGNKDMAEYASVRVKQLKQS